MSVAGPYVAAATRQSPSRLAAKSKPRSANYQPTPTGSDPYYNHREIAEICMRFIKSLFACPDRPPPSTTSPSTPTPTLAIFVAYALHRTRLHSSVTFTALFLLSRLKSRFPAARGSSGHRLFISAFMIASKVVCDDTYSNKSWTVVGQGMFSLREINQMEREMCGYLEWILNVDPKELEEFEAIVRHDYCADGSCPPFVHMHQQQQQQQQQGPPSSSVATPMTPPASPTRRSVTVPAAAAPVAAAIPSPSRSQDISRAPSAQSTASSIQPPPSAPFVQIPRVPIVVDARLATPPLGDNNSPSPASSTACVTPQSDDDDQDDATIVTMGLHRHHHPHHHYYHPEEQQHEDILGPQIRSHSVMSMGDTSSVASMPPKSKMGRDPSFAFVSRTVW